jgi:hypothetical protein
MHVLWPHLHPLISIRNFVKGITMAHLVEQMAYVGAAPWHALGHQLPPKQPLEVWAQKAGMDWTIRETPVRYLAQPEDGGSAIMAFDEQKVLYRSDTNAPLSVVSVSAPIQI